MNAILQKILQKKPIGILVLFLLAALGIALLLYGGSGKEEKTETLSEEAELSAYRTELEAEITALCGHVKGVKSVRVTVTLESGYTNIYATEEGKNGESFVIVGSGSNAKGLLLAREFPEIRGIGVVCTGGGNETVRKELISLLSATYHIATNRIFVTEGD